MRMVMGGEEGRGTGGGFVVPRGPSVGIEMLSEDEDEDEEDEGNEDGNGGLTARVGRMDVSGPTSPLKEDGKKVEAYKDDNRRWKKAAKKAEKSSGMPNLHLASS